MGRPKGRLCGHDPSEWGKWDCRQCKRERDARYRERERANRQPAPKKVVTQPQRNQHFGRQPMHCLICLESFQTHPLRSCLPLRRPGHSPMRGVLAGEGRGAA